MKCPHCRAPIAVPETGLEMTCAYCGHNAPVPDAAQRRQKAQQEAQRRREAELQQQQAVHHAKVVGRTARHGVLLAFLSMVPVLLIAGVSTYPLWKDKLKSHTWDGTSTLVCELNEKIHLSDVTANISDGPVFEMKTNCHITCENCDLRGVTIAELGINGEITLRGGTAKAEGVAFFFDGPNGKVKGVDVELTASTMIEGGRPNVHLSGGTVTATDTAFDLPHHSTLSLRKTRVTAPVPLNMGTHADVRVYGGALLGDELAARVDNHAELSLRGEPEIRGDIEKIGRHSKVDGQGER